MPPDHESDGHYDLETEDGSIIGHNTSRRETRSLIFHVLYVAESLDYEDSIDQIIDNLNRGYGLSLEPEGEIASTARTIVAHRENLDAQYKPFLQNWHLDRISVCTKLVIRYAIWELQNTDTDPRIVINEAIELAKCFAEQDAYKFVNGILDQTINTIRHTSTSEETSSSS